MHKIAVIWALSGFTALLGAAIVRLGSMALDSWSTELTTGQFMLLLGNLLLMAYSEGYRGFQLRFSPRFARRLLKLKASGSNMQCLLAPLYCMNYVSASRRQLLVAYVLALLIILFIIGFHYIPQPWRGILDAGVVLGLTWGLVATWVCALSALLQPASKPMNTNPA